MKQMPVESGLAQVGMPSRFAIARTSLLAMSPRGNSAGWSCSWGQSMHEIRLVLGLTAPSAVNCAAFAAPRACVMAGGDPVGTEHPRMIEESAELISLLHSTSGLGCARGRVIAQKVREHALAIF